jgi:hypothetical protein
MRDLAAGREQKFVVFPAAHAGALSLAFLLAFWRGRLLVGFGQCARLREFIHASQRASADAVQMGMRGLNASH